MDKTTQGVEEDVIAQLEEMVKALQKAIKEADKRKQANQQQGQPTDPPLVDVLGEIKMIRSLQIRVNIRTNRYSKLIGAGEQAEQADLVDAIRRLAERRERIFQSDPGPGNGEDSMNTKRCGVRVILSEARVILSEAKDLGKLGRFFAAPQNDSWLPRCSLYVRAPFRTAVLWTAAVVCLAGVAARGQTPDAADSPAWQPPAAEAVRRKPSLGSTSARPIRACGKRQPNSGRPGRSIRRGSSSWSGW